MIIMFHIKKGTPAKQEVPFLFHRIKVLQNKD